MDSSKELLAGLLQIINYSNNREKFIAEFEANSHLEAINNTLEKLPSDIRGKIGLITHDPAALKQYFSLDEYHKEFKKVFDRDIEKLIEVVSPLLTLAQKQKITKLLQNGTIH